MKLTGKLFLLLTTIVATTACKKPVVLVPVGGNSSYLVVDGFINVGDSTHILLSRTVNLDGNARSAPELNATITIESSGGNTYSLTTMGKGDYKSPVLNLPTDQKYRLKIITSNGKQYASDYIVVKNSPAIDSVGYQVKNDGLAMTVNTHDPSNNTRYYRWDYTSTYIVQSMFESKYVVVNQDTTALRTADQQIYHCWVTDTSTTIVLGSSAKLAEDRISGQQVAFLLPTAESLRIKFSILVKQHALTSEAFSYYDALNKNSTQVGGVFDAQPSELTGNIHNLTDPTETVIGFVTAGAVAQKRLFVSASQLPAMWQPNLSYYNGCALITELYDYIPDMAPPGYVEHQVKEFIYSGVETPIDTIRNPKAGMTSAKHYCADCTLRGTNKKPSFWK